MYSGRDEGGTGVSTFACFIVLEGRAVKSFEPHASYR